MTMMILVYQNSETKQKSIHFARACHPSERLSPTIIRGPLADLVSECALFVVDYLSSRTPFDEGEDLVLCLLTGDDLESCLEDGDDLREGCCAGC